MIRALKRLECHWYVRATVAAIMGIFLGVVITELYREVDAQDNLPIIIGRVETLNSPIKEGDYLEIRVHREKPRSDCSLRADRWVQDQDGKAIDIPDYQGPGGEPKTPYTDIVYDTRNIPAGSWYLVSNLVYKCGNKYYSIMQGPTPFRVVE